MSDTPTQKLVITKEELRDPKVDEAIRQQRPFERPEDNGPKKSGFRLLYAAWFYLLLAGAAGAVAGWALIEPSLEEGVRFKGRVQQVEPDALPRTFRGTVREIRGRLRVADVDVYLFPDHTRIVAGPPKRRLSIDDLKPGQVVSILGVPALEANSMLAIVVRLEGAVSVAETSVIVSALQNKVILYQFLLFPTVAGLVGLMVGAVEGIVCRTFTRAAWCGAIGLLSGLVGGAISLILAGIVFTVVGKIPGVVVDSSASAPAFIFMMFRRGLSWTVAGMAMGLGQGFALKSSKLVLNGFIGGMVGGLAGGLLFDPLNRLLSDEELMQGAGLSRAVGLMVIGATVGLMIGLTELLTRDAWLKVMSGPLRGKEFGFYRTPIRLGNSPRNEIHLFKDPKIDPVHAEINKLRDAFEVVDGGSSTGTFVNGRRIRRHRLADGDVIKIGDCELAYYTRERPRA